MGSKLNGLFNNVLEERREILKYATPDEIIRQIVEAIQTLTNKEKETSQKQACFIRVNLQHDKHVQVIEDNYSGKILLTTQKCSKENFKKVKKFFKNAKRHRKANEALIDEDGFLIKLD